MMTMFFFEGDLDADSLMAEEAESEAMSTSEEIE